MALKRANGILYFRSIPVHYATPKNHRLDLSAVTTDHVAATVAATISVIVVLVVVVCDLIFHPARDVSGVARQRGSAVGWVMSGNAANEVYEDT